MWFRANMTTLFQPDCLFVAGRMHAAAGLLVDPLGRIVRVTTSDESKRSSSVPADTRVVELRGKALLPGFVNVHSHAFQRMIRGRTESHCTGGPDFWSWRADMYHAAASLSPEQMYHVARIAFLEMALAGTTTGVSFIMSIALRKASRIPMRTSWRNKSSRRRSLWEFVFACCAPPINALDMGCRLILGNPVFWNRQRSFLRMSPTSIVNTIRPTHGLA